HQQRVTTYPRFRNPSAAEHQIAVVEHNGLAWSNGTLGLVEGDADFTVCGRLNDGRCGVMTMADLGMKAHGRLGLHTGAIGIRDRRRGRLRSTRSTSKLGLERLNGDPVQVAGDQGT